MQRWTLEESCGTILHQTVCQVQSLVFPALILRRMCGLCIMITSAAKDSASQTMDCWIETTIMEQEVNGAEVCMPSHVFPSFCG